MPYAVPGHAGVADPDHVAHALLEQLLRDREHPPLRHARAAQRPGVAQDEHRVGVDVQRRVVDARGDVVVVLEDDRAARVLVASTRAGVLDHGAVGRERAAEDREARLGRQRVRARPDDVVVEDLRAAQGVATATSRRRSSRRADRGGPSTPRRPPASKKSCIRYLPDGRRLASTGTLRESSSKRSSDQRDAGPAGHRDQVDDRVGRTAEREHDRDRVLEVLRRQLQRRQRRRSAAPRRPPCADDPNARPGSRRRPARSRPAPRPPTSSSTPSPSSCSARARRRSPARPPPSRPG